MVGERRWREGGTDLAYLTLFHLQKWGQKSHENRVSYKISGPSCLWPAQKYCECGLFCGILVLPFGIRKCRDAWKWGRGFILNVKSKKKKKIGNFGAGFDFWADTQDKSYFVWPLPPTNGWHFQQWYDGQSPGRFHSIALFCSWLWIEHISYRARLTPVQKGMRWSFVRTYTHARLNQFSPACWGVSVTLSEARVWFKLF